MQTTPTVAGPQSTLRYGWDPDDVTDWLRRFCDLVASRSNWLTILDTAIGDADHGTILSAGTAALRPRLGAGHRARPASIFRLCGQTLRASAGGAGGALYSSYFLGLADGAGSSPTLDLPTLADAFTGGVSGVIARGHAGRGDKTLVDVFEPTAEALREAAAAGLDAETAAERTYQVALRERDATVALVARKGRASYLGERSAGHIDPGAASATLLFQALLESTQDPLSAPGSVMSHDHQRQ